MYPQTTNQLVTPPLHPFVPEQTRGNLCHCGKETVESHEFYFCSTQCARQDSLRALDDPQCHYRDAMRRAQARAGVPPFHPRRMMSIDDFRPSAVAQVPSPNAPALMRDNWNVGGFPTLSQVTGKVLSKKSVEGQVLKASSPDRPRWQGFPNASKCSDPVPFGKPVAQISLDVVPLPDDAPRRTLRRAPQSSESLRSAIRQSVVTFMKGGKARPKNKQGEQQMVFGHPVNEISPPVEVDPRSPLPRPVIVEERATGRKQKALRRSVSFAGWDATTTAEDTLLQIIEEMKEEMGESFDL